MELLKMTDMSKAFFGVSVLKEVSFEIESGEVHALMGENGAGKSTLMNILGGIYTKDSGTVFFNGDKLDNISIKETENAGIAFVHQELNIFNNLMVFENLFLGKELVTSYGKLKKKEMIEETNELMKNLGVDISPTALADDLDTSKKQLLEIAKALHSDAKLIILDEPTTALNNEEITHLFKIITQLKNLGKSFVFISHKMPEIFKIADRFTILRNGLLIKSGNIKDTTPEEVTKLMVGESYSTKEMYVERHLGDTVLKLVKLSGKGFSNINFSIKRGEIVGFTGLQGSGCSEVLQTIFGVVKTAGGQIFIHGNEVKCHNIHNAMRSHVAMVPANRKENSIIADMTLLDNTCISEHNLNFRRQHIFKKQEIEKYDEYKIMLDIKALSHDAYITSLSGGNMQKVILARWLKTKADILLFDNPTQGIDVGTKSEIYKLILDLSKSGKTIIVNTLEIPEIQKIADRCVVFYHGRVAVELDRSEISEETVMLYATNAFNKKEFDGEVEYV